VSKKLKPSTEAPTFFGKKMRWVGSEKPRFTGSFWKYRSPDGDLVVRAWPAEENFNCPDTIDKPEVQLSTPRHTVDVSLHFMGRSNTHKGLLEALKKAESEVLRRFHEVGKEYHILRKVTQ